MNPLLAPAPFADVLRGRAPLVGSRLDPNRPRGFVSPIEARIALGIAYGDLAREEMDYFAKRSLRRDASLCTRALLVRTFAPRNGGRSEARPFIVSARVENVDIDGALDAIFAAPDGSRARFVHFVHPHALNVAARDRALARMLADADLVLADGIGIRVAAALLGVSLRANLNGTDLLPLLCRRAAAMSIPLALVGSAPGVAHACADRLRRAHAGLSIPLVAHGYLDSSEAARVRERIRAMGRSIVLVGMGTPMQERWAHDHLRDVKGATVLTVGGLFDFYSGRIPRAPVAWRELGLEWLYRLIQEPGRLTRRYLVGNPVFVARALLQRTRTGRQRGVTFEAPTSGA